MASYLSQELSVSRVPPLPADQLDGELRQIIEASEDILGFTPNDGLIMARHPAMARAVLELVRAVYAPGSVAIELKKLVALMSSSASGCQYCQAHTSLGAFESGVTKEKIAAIWEYAESPLFNEAERAALDLARNASLVPNGVSDGQFEVLREHFDDEQLVELTGVISLFGFLNRWNATLATELEEAPDSFRRSLQTEV
jgi:uncharacterized peroxidase-related enzyme